VVRGVIANGDTAKLLVGPYPALAVSQCGCRDTIALLLGVIADNDTAELPVGPEPPVGMSECGCTGIMARPPVMVRAKPAMGVPEDGVSATMQPLRGDIPKEGNRGATKLVVGPRPMEALTGDGRRITDLLAGEVLVVV